MNQKTHNVIDIQQYFLLGMIVILLVLFMIFLSSFFSTILIALIVVAGVYPLHKLLNKKAKLPGTVSALISLIAVAVVILTPFTIFLFMISHQAVGAYDTISLKINDMLANHSDILPSLFKKGFIDSMLKNISGYAPISTSDVITTAKDFVGKISTIILGQTTNIIKNLSFFVIHLIVLLLAMFYFLRDGQKLKEYINSLLPLSDEYSEELFNKLSRLSYGIIYGLFGAAIVQGLLVGIALFIVGVNNAAFWGAVAALLSPLPYIGTSVVWIPAVIALLVGHHYIAAIFLLAWCVLIVSVADNVVKPFLIGSSTTLHPLAVLLTLLGGAFAFGLKGLLFGPFVLTLTLAFLHIYRLEYKGSIKSKRVPSAE